MENETHKAKVPKAHKSQSAALLSASPLWSLFLFSIIFYTFISSLPLPTLYYFKPVILLPLAFSSLYPYDHLV